MTIGSVDINQIDQNQGQINEIERYFLFVGLGVKNISSLKFVNNDSDFIDLLGDTNLSKQLDIARMNAGQNWQAAFYALDADENYHDVVELLIAHHEFEAIVITDNITSSDDLKKMQNLADVSMSQHRQPVFFISTCSQCASDESWTDYSARLKTYVDGLICPNVLVVPSIFGDEIGALSGRLCNRSVTVADTPMRVATGALKGNFDANQFPVDKEGVVLNRALLAELHRNRFVVINWYPNYLGFYFSDGLMLEKETGDYKLIEYIRVIHAVIRKIYPLAVARIGDKQLNSTPLSIESNKTYFMRPLMDMAKNIYINGFVFFGLIEQPSDDAINIVWKTKYDVSLYLKIKPYNCPKTITVNLILDLSN